MNKTIEKIALKTLGVSTLETRNSDGLDFHSLAVWSLKSALESAYEAGKRQAASAQARKAGKAGRGKSKARTSEQARAAVNARWAKVKKKD